MKHRVAELEGALLDAAVAKAEGMQAVLSHYPGDGSNPITKCKETWTTTDGRLCAKTYAPSTRWEIGGPIIEREGICIAGNRASMSLYDLYHGYGAVFEGPTSLIAAMRAYCTSKFGEEVELP